MALTQVSTGGVKDGTILNADLNASAAIAGTKIADFVTGNTNNRVLTATGTTNSLNGEAALVFDGTRLGVGGTPDNIALDITKNTQAGLRITDSAVTNASYEIRTQTGNSTKLFRIIDVSASADRLKINENGRVIVSTPNLLDAFQVDYGGGFNLVFDGAGNISQFRANGSNGGLTIDTALTSGSWGSADAGFISFKPKGTQTFLLTTSGATVQGNLTVSSSLAKIVMNDTDGGDSFQLRNDAGTFIIRNGTDSKSALTIDGACVTSILNPTPPATGVSVLHVSNSGSASTLGTAATCRISNNGGNGAYSVFEAESSTGSIRLANDGQFYVTGASTFSGELLMNGHPLRRNQHQWGHLEGSYNNIGENSSKSNPIYTIGSSYNPAESTLSNMYGIGFSHGNASFTPSGVGWGLYVAANGTSRIYLDAGSGNIHLSANSSSGGTLFFANGGWTGDFANGKIQTYAGHMYLQNAGTGSSWFFRSNNGSTAATIASNGAYTASDLTFKKDVVTISNSVDTIKKLTGRSFTWKEDDKKSFGVIAQEVETVLPELVTTTEEPEGSEIEPKKMVNYSAFAGHFIEAIKELATKVEALETEVAVLKAS